MKILVLGGDGMLGSQLVRSWAGRHEVVATHRQGPAAYPHLDEGARARDRFGFDARSLPDLLDLLEEARPQAVVNAVGLVKQRPEAEDPLPSLELNALLPHRLARAARLAGARLLHLSTDCVFSGRRGGYREEDPADAEDLYGRTKYLGEVGGPGVLTLRSSIIGLETSRKTSLVEWFLAQKGPIRGYRGALYTGLTTAEMARAMEHLLIHDGDLQGLWHLASEPISKFDLLAGLAARLGRRDLEILPDETFRCDRSLDGSALMARTGYRVPGWARMLDELAEQILERGSASCC